MSGYHHPQHQYDDGLEVAHSDAPEWVSSAGGTSTDYELGQKIPVVSEPYDQYKVVNDGAMGGPGHSAGAYAAGGPVVTSVRPWYKRKLVLGIIVAVIIVGIALGVGLGVGLNSGSDSSSGGDGDDSDGGDSSSSPCKGDFCARILTTSLFNDSLYVFGRSEDKTSINFIEHNGNEWLDWGDVGTIGTDSEIIKPPTTQAWAVNATDWRLDVFVVIDDVRESVYNTWLTDQEGWPQWERLGNNIRGPVSTCAVHISGEPDRLDVWGVDATSNDIVKTMWRQLPDDDIPEEGFDGVTNATGSYQPSPDWAEQDPLRPARPQPAVVCAISEDDSERFHDIVWYQPDEDKAWHSSFSNEDGWSSQSEWGGKWIGHPGIHTSNSKRTDGYFFGVQEDHELYHMSWNEDGTFSSNQPESLGGPIYSAPAFWADGEGNLDLVALGEDGMLKHLHKGSRAADWDSEWENLSVKAASAPMTRMFQDKLWIFAVNGDGELKAWTVDPGSSNWADDLEEEGPLDGTLSLEY